MAIKISDMQPYSGSLHPEDMFETTIQNELKTYSVTAAQIAEYCKTLNNGGFRGYTTKNFDDFTADDIGIWWWQGGENSPSAPIPSITQCFVEIISYSKTLTDSTIPGEQGQVYPSILQRVSIGTLVYQRTFYENKWWQWGSLSNRNGCKIVYGTATAASGGTLVPYDPTNPEFHFSSNPCINLTVVANDQNNVYMPQIINITNSNFTFRVWKSSVVEVVEEVSENTTTTQTGETSKTTTSSVTKTTHGRWTEADNVSVMWSAMLEEG